MADVAAQLNASLNALTREFDTIAHNLANVSTAGYKRQCSSFTKTLATQSGENPAHGSLDFSQGHLIETHRTLDVALYGKGFFVIETPEGPLYTRHGVFRENPNGQIVDAEGRVVAGANGPLNIPQTTDVSQITVSQDGQISTGGSVVGQFRVVEFGENEGQLVPVGLCCFQAPKDVEPTDAQNVVVRQGCQEASNVKMAEELVSMILVTRMYEANMKLVNVKKDTTNSIIGVAMG
ncbi:MAG: flagellar hook basal-body protein [Sedimentisphaerales bacterium]|nr:flagellar hook basal-body protein [Sedimentisphaerales bacterium]